MKEVAVFFCDQDLASQNILNEVQEHFKLDTASYVFDNHPVHLYRNDFATFYLCRTQQYIYQNGKKYADMLANVLPGAECALIAGFHEGQSGAILTIHSIGNTGASQQRYAAPYTLAKTSTTVVKNIILAFGRYQQEFDLEGFEVMQEVTHGSPVEFPIPILDVEIGSTPTEYRNSVAGKVLAYSIFQACNPLSRLKHAIAFGGLHYASKFVKANLLGSYAVGHIFPSSTLNDFNRDILYQAVRQTRENVTHLVIDKSEKGMYKTRARECAEELGLETVNHNRTYE